jgi:HSP20 family molecular chaperone IbpA
MSTLTDRDRGSRPENSSGVAAWSLAQASPASGSAMPVEDYIRNGQYELRAELPGLDPERDIEITVAGEILTITAHRPEDTRGRQHSEFRYRTAERSFRLPPSADLSRIQASYGHGFLTVCVTLVPDTEAPFSRPIPVLADQHIRPT